MKINWEFIGNCLKKLFGTIEHMVLGFLAGIVFIIWAIVKWLFIS